jgi:hypothetical protein
MMGNYAIRKKIRGLLLVAIMLGLCSCASGYYLYIDAPSNIRVGEEIHFEGSTNTPPPDIIYIVFSQVSGSPVEIDRISIPIDDRGETTFSGTFSTRGLGAGRYRIEGSSDSKRNFSGDSRLLRVVTLEDRTNEVSLTSQREQWVSDILKVAGTIRNFRDASLTFELKKDEETVFGPSQVPVSYGQFDYNIPVSEPGIYMLLISDYRGLIGEYQYVLHAEDERSTPFQEEIVRPTAEPTQIEGPEVNTEVPTPVPIEVLTSAPTNIPTSVPTEVPTTIATMASTIVPVDEATTEFQYHARLSRADSGFYMIEPSDDIVTITTTTGVDWVIEYIDPITQSKHRVNDADAYTAESVTISTDGSPIYVKIYPYSFNEVADITIFGTGIASMGANNKARVAFGSPPSSTLEENIVRLSDSTTESPLSILTLLFGLGACLFLRREF